MSANSGLSPNVVKTALDDVFNQEFNRMEQPNIATALTSDIFKQMPVDNAAYITEVLAGTGYWKSRAEEQDVASSTPISTDKATYAINNYADSIDISKNMFDDNLHGTVNKWIETFGNRARLTRDKTGFGLYRNAFTTTLTANGTAWISDSQSTISGATVDNRLTAALSPTALEDAIVMLGEQLAQDGTIVGHTPASLLVPLKLFKEAVEITDSQLISDSANNAINWVSAKYGIKVYTSPFLGAAADGSDTAWFLMGRFHSGHRFIRQDVTTDLVGYETQRNNNYIYKGEYRETYGAIAYEGIVGSLGTA